jgi:predicted dehydrogenase
MLSSIPGIELKVVYYPFDVESSEFPVTMDFESVRSCDGVVISSPTPTHMEYLELLNDYNGYILLEKPAVSTLEQITIIKNWSNEKKSRIHVNFNLPFSSIYKVFNSLIQNKKLGKLIAVDIATSHGLAFKPHYRESWRHKAGKSGGVLETVGIHYINLLLNVFGSYEDVQSHFQWVAHRDGTPDTATLIFKMNDGLRATLRHSYAAPALYKWFVLGSSAYWEYDGFKARLYGPRDTFDSDGRFTSPPLVEEHNLPRTVDWKESLSASVNKFCNVVKDNGQFDITLFDRAVDSSLPILKSLNQIQS